mmetsp:Transcript_6234/g.13574  ORF Transcript_6234/g.13574 Transcript_6234/m.13574 type:complete len:216 (+) Transcript_6234:302-949(+)
MSLTHNRQFISSLSLGLSLARAPYISCLSSSTRGCGGCVLRGRGGTQAESSDERRTKGGGRAAEGSGEAELAEREEDADDDEIEWDAEEVHNHATVLVREIFAAEGADKGEVHAHAGLESEEGGDERCYPPAGGPCSGGHGAGGHGEHGRHRVLGLDGALRKGREERGADHAANHEAREDLAKRDCAAERRLERWRPLQHKDVHGTLEQGLNSSN